MNHNRQNKNIENVFGKIYKVTSPSGKCYIGQTTFSIEQRKSLHMGEARQDLKNRTNNKFHNALLKYQNEMKWEILYDNIEFVKLNDLEKETIEKYDSFKNGYNSTVGGDSGFLHSEETKLKISETRKGKNYGLVGKNSPLYGRKLSESVKAKISKSHIGLHVGEKNPMFGKTRKHTLEARLKISEGLRRAHLKKIAAKDHNVK